MRRFEPVLLEQCPDILLVVGDVNSTIACTLVASKIDYPQEKRLRRPVICHVEAGLRSFDRDMPEEINRILTDTISDLLFVTEESGQINLTNEGTRKGKIFFVGNVMIDTLHQHLEMAEKSLIRQQYEIIDKRYVLVTLHRPSNVDQEETLMPLINCITEMADKRSLVFPVHPRTRNKMVDFGLWEILENNPNVILTEPLSYLDFLNLIKNASLVVTDSGGIQEETTVLNVPCITLRDNTERPVTVDMGTNYLIGTSPADIMETFTSIIEGHEKHGEIPPFWDGQAGDRIVEILVKKCSDHTGSSL
jgi:UDP-N-acetylglucosamine 2-epimerase (non-hydrolysing)